MQRWRSSHTAHDGVRENGQRSFQVAQPLDFQGSGKTVIWISGQIGAFLASFDDIPRHDGDRK
jgi:hypothetical protein